MNEGSIVIKILAEFKNIVRVEDCSQALLTEILPHVDPDKVGVCIDVGVGTFAFYCELFANLGFCSIAIEPLPTKKLLKLCHDRNITLIQGCLSDTNDIQTLYIGKFAGIYNLNLNSLSPDWFGSSYKEQQVNVIDIPTLLKRIKPETITCMKLDIEGTEVNVLKQFIELPEHLKPQIIMFEYGGGSRKSKAKKGWSPKFLKSTINSLNYLKESGYNLSLTIDYASNTKVKIFNLQTASIEPDILFDDNFIYGNIISFYNKSYSQENIEKICSSYEKSFVNHLIATIFCN